MTGRSLLAGILGALALEGCGDFEETSMCVAVDDGAAACPAPEDVDLDAMVNFGWCDAAVKELTGEGEVVDDPIDPEGGPYCCYPALARNTEPNCVVGRPFVVAGEARAADVRPGSGWSAPSTGAPGAVDWEAMARAEHASIASFAKLTLELLAHGAPADLLAEAQRAAADEVEHARLCFGMLASGGRAVEPGPLPVPAFEVGDLASLAAATVREGCLGETLGAWLAGRAAEGCAEPAVREVLARIAEDEARHAALSWRVVAWALRVGGPDVRQAVERAFAEPFGVTPPAGLASDEALEGWVEEGRERVLTPATRALLAA